MQAAATDQNARTDGTTAAPVTPDQLATLTRIASPLWWVITAVLAMMSLAITIWGIWGHVYVSVSGLGMVLPSEGSLTTVRSDASGTVSKIVATIDSGVKAGDVLAVVTQPRLAADLDAAKAALALLQKQVDSLTGSAGTSAEQLFALERDLLSAQQKVDALTLSLTLSQNIVSPIDGQVASIVTAEGKTVAEGDAVAVIEPAFSKVYVAAYFQIADAKRIRTGAKASVEISSIDTDIYGTAVGTVTYVADLASTPEELQNTFDNSILVQGFEGESAPIKAIIELEQDPANPRHVIMSSGRSSPTKVSIGTSVAAQVVIEQDPPISYVIKMFD